MGIGHADDKKKDKPRTITLMEHANIGCNEDAELCIEICITATSFKPLPGYCAMLQLDGNWITTQFRAVVRHANTAPAMVIYVKKRLNISTETFNNINWGAIGTVRASHGR